MLLGIAIPYYCNSMQAENKFKELMEYMDKELKSNMILYIYEDGQVSDWLDKYSSYNVIIERSVINKGVAYARNKCINYLKDKVDYILFIDSDDRLSDNYLSYMYLACRSDKYDIIESAFNYKGHIFEFKPLVKRGGMTGSAFKSSMIGDLQFDETLQVGEDTKFMDELLDFSKHKKLYCKYAIYYYNYAANPKSLIVRFKKGEIEKVRK